MLNAKRSRYFTQKLLTLRGAIDELLEEMKEEQEAPESPRIRRNLKKERIDHHEQNYSIGTWRKPKQLKKALS